MTIAATTTTGDSTPPCQPIPARGSGAWALLHKETMRFVKVAVQTILAPVVSSLLFLLIFAHLLEGRVEPHPGMSYTAFLVPGLIMMTLQQNAFANSSSSLTQSKITGNLVFLLLSPMHPWEWFAGYIGGAVLRGLACGLSVWLVAMVFVPLPLHSLAWILSFAILACVVLATLGFIAGLWAEKWDHVSAFQNFLINPLTFLAGVFYSVHQLPPVWQAISHLNPFFYLIDGFRFGFFGVADVSPWLSLGISAGAALILTVITLTLIRSGWRVRG
jgi:ABC-2 type transport system permease protein